MTHPSLLNAALLKATLALPGCASQQLFGVGEAWQQQECARIADAQERQRCMASTQATYDAYRKDAEAAQRQRR